MYWEDESNYCECCLQPAESAIKKYHTCSKAETMDCAGSGIPLYFLIQKYFIWMMIIIGIGGTA